MEFLGIIPARYASTRFPGKPLVDINGKPMIQHVYEQSAKSLRLLYVATDDQRIEKAVKGFGGNVVMTSPEHQSGTDRVAEASQIIGGLGIDFDVVINIQGDEPFIKKSQIENIKSCFDQKETEIATLIKPISNFQELIDPNIPKVVIGAKKQAIYFSRSPIPYYRGEEMEEWCKINMYYKHIGMYAYTHSSLLQITKIPQSPLEKAESLEQLRWVEHGFKIITEVTHEETISIDTPEDLKKLDTTA